MLKVTPVMFCLYLNDPKNYRNCLAVVCRPFFLLHKTTLYRISFDIFMLFAVHQSSSFALVW